MSVERPPRNALHDPTWMIPLVLYAGTLFIFPVPSWAIVGSILGLMVLAAASTWGRKFDGKALIAVIAVSVAFGMALAPAGGAWSLFFAYGAIMAGRLRRRPIANLALASLAVILIGYGLLLSLPIFQWGPGLLFGAAGGISAMHRRELEEKNEALRKASLEVRHLAAVAERERIAHDLHDLLGQTLTLIAVKGDLAKRLVGRDDAAASREAGDIAEAARTALAEVRAAVSGMRSSSIQAELARAASGLQTAGIAASLPNALVPISAGGEAILAMVLREAVTNVIRHSGATRCQVELDRTGNEVRMHVSDDGHGSELVEGWGLSAAVELGLASRPSAMPSGIDPVLTLRPNAFGGGERFAVDARITAVPEAPASGPSIRIDMRRLVRALVGADDTEAHVGLGKGMRNLDETFGWSSAELPDVADLSAMPRGETFLDEGPYFERAMVLLSHVEPFDREVCPVETARLTALLSYLRRPAPVDAWKAEIGDRADGFRLKHLLSAWASRLGIGDDRDQADTFHRGVGDAACERATAILQKVAAASRIRQ